MSNLRNSALEGLLTQYSTGTPGTLKGVNSFLSTASKKGGLPGFEDIFQNFEAGVNKRTDREAAKLHEAFGSQGNRLSSDLLRAESDLRSGAARDIIAGAAPLRAAQISEVGTLGNLALGSAGLENQINEAAANRLYLDFIRQSTPPPLLEGLANFALGLGTAGQPATVIQ